MSKEKRNKQTQAFEMSLERYSSDGTEKGEKSVMCDICENDTSKPMVDKFDSVVCPVCYVITSKLYYAKKLDELVRTVDTGFVLAEETVGNLEDNIEAILEAIPYLGKCHLLSIVYKYKDMRECGVFENYRIDLYDQASKRLQELLAK